jgi:hypothetical protein
VKCKLGVDQKLLLSRHDTQQEHHARIEQLREDMLTGFGDMRSEFERVHDGVETIQRLLTRNLGEDDPES